MARVFMEYFKIKDNNYKLSRFTIGTVQLGKTYGIDTLGNPLMRKHNQY